MGEITKRIPYDKEYTDCTNCQTITMLEIFKASIDAGIYPARDSECYKKLVEIIENKKAPD